MRFYGAEYNNIELGIRLVQYCCTLLHKTSYWSRSSAVIVYYLLHNSRGEAYTHSRLQLLVECKTKLISNAKIYYLFYNSRGETHTHSHVCNYRLNVKKNLIWNDKINSLFYNPRRKTHIHSHVNSPIALIPIITR